VPAHLAQIRPLYDLYVRTNMWAAAPIGPGPLRTMSGAAR
jgi:hypothetical protein